jgi:hypothetical protein
MPMTIALILAAAVAAAPAEQLAAAFDNTIVSTYPSGRSARLWLAQDGTYTARGAKGAASSGVWSMKGARLCLKQKKPYAAPVTYCSPVPQGAKVGSAWDAKSLKGEPLRNRIVEGR